MGKAAEAAEKSGSLQDELLEREHTLDQKQFYGNSNYPGDSPGKAMLEAETSLIATAEESVKSAQDRIAALERELAAPTVPGSSPPR